MRAINLSKVNLPVRFKGREIRLELGDFTSRQLDLFHQLTGQELANVFLGPWNPRLVLRAIYVHDTVAQPGLTWEAFSGDVRPYDDLEMLVSDGLPPDDDQPATTGEAGEPLDPEA